MRELQEILSRQEEILDSALSLASEGVDSVFALDFELFVKGEDASPQFKKYLESNPACQKAVETYFKAMLLQFDRMVSILDKLSGKT